MFKKTIITLTALAFATFVFAQSADVFNKLATPDAKTGATVVVTQDEAISNLFNRQTVSTTTRGTVYRVQVFSSNNQKTAKSDAFNVEKQLKNAFPDQSVQVNYSSPFWKVRIGEFNERSDAQQFCNKVMDALPGLKKQIYVISVRTGAK